MIVQPIFKCRSCERWVNHKCKYFNRPTDPDNNKCFAHSIYNSNLKLKFEYSEDKQLLPIKQDFLFT